MADTQTNEACTDESVHVIAPHAVAQAVKRAIRSCAVTLRSDCACATQGALENAQAVGHLKEAGILEDILENDRIAQTADVPLCQDTGSVWVLLEAGPDVLVPGNVFSGVDDAVKDAYQAGGLRMSMVHDALMDRSNTNTNTPAFTEIRTSDEPGCRLHVMLKGGGSDNASRVVMLAPGAGREGVQRVVMDTVREKAANACPPLIVGVGVGGTFDKVAGLSKRALLRTVGTQHSNPKIAAFEQELLDAVNATGVGAGGQGGTCTAHAVFVESAPCHIAALPVAVNLGCCAMRSASFHLQPEGDFQ